jgi:hypothetical protein
MVTSMVGDASPPAYRGLGLSYSPLSNHTHGVSEVRNALPLGATITTQGICIGWGTMARTMAGNMFCRGFATSSSTSSFEIARFLSSGCPMGLKALFGTQSSLHLLSLFGRCVLMCFFYPFHKV